MAKMPPFPKSTSLVGYVFRAVFDGRREDVKGIEIVETGILVEDNHVLGERSLFQRIAEAGTLEVAIPTVAMNDWMRNRRIGDPPNPAGVVFQYDRLGSALELPFAVHVTGNLLVERVLFRAYSRGPRRLATLADFPDIETT